MMKRNLKRLTMVMAFTILGACLGSGSYVNYFSNGPALNNDMWHFITVTVDRDQPTGLKMYVNGSLFYTDNPTVRPGNISNTNDLYIGKHLEWPENNFHGYLDEVYLINRALTTTEVFDFYHNNIDIIVGV